MWVREAGREQRRTEAGRNQRRFRRRSRFKDGPAGEQEILSWVDIQIQSARHSDNSSMKRREGGWLGSGLGVGLVKTASMRQMVNTELLFTSTHSTKQ